MATTYTLNSDSYNGRYLKLSCTQTQNIANNTSTISWTLSSVGGSATYYYTGPTTVTINGEQVYYSDRTGSGFPAIKGSTSGTLVVNHDAKGEKSVSLKISTAIYTKTVSTTSATWTLDANPRAAQITSATNVYSNSNPTINYSNTIGAGATKLEAFIYADDDTTILMDAYTLDKTGTSAELVLSDAAINSFLQRTITQASTEITVYFYIKTTIGTQPYWSDRVAKKFYVVNGEPEIHSTVYDVNEKTTALTGDNGKFIKYFSDAQFQVEATAKLGASIVSYNAICGNKSSTLQQSTFYNIDVDTITFTATDNRNNTGAYEYSLDLIEYFHPTLNYEAELVLVNETEAQFNISLEGKFFNASFGAKTNSISLCYRLAEGSGEYGEWIDFEGEPTIEGNEYSYNDVVSGLNYEKSHTIQFAINDALHSTQSTPYTAKLTPVFDWSDTDFNFNVPIKIQGENLADYVIETGTASMGSNGTWFWEKWKSGKSQCYGCRNYGNMAVSTAWGSLYESATFNQSLPSGLFTNDPDYIDIEVLQSGGAAWVVQGFGDVSTSNTGSFSVVRPVSGNLTQVWLGFNVLGRWK